MVKIVFFGSGPVAAKSLESLAANFDIEAVITKRVPPHHKHAAPVETLAKTLEAPIHFADTKREVDEVVSSNQFASRVGVVVDFGVIILPETIKAFELGIINSHFSLLPEWRGADPITFTVLSGQKITGVSLMLIVEKLDEGELLAQATYDISDDITAPKLTEDLIDLSDAMLRDIIPEYINCNITPRPQAEMAQMIGVSDIATYSRKLTKADGRIDWTKPAEQIEREIRAYIEWPKSTGLIGNQNLIIRAAEIVDTNGLPGEFEATKTSLNVYCGEKALNIKSVQPSGKKEMPIQAFLSGYKLG